MNLTFLQIELNMREKEMKTNKPKKKNKKK